MQIALIAARERPPREGRQPREEPPLGDIEQVVAPGDRVPQRLLPRGHIARTARRYRPAVCEVFEQGEGRQQPGVGRRQLDRQREAIEPPADGRHRRRVLRGQREVLPDGAGALREEADRIGRGECRQGRHLFWIRQRERRDDAFALAPQPQRRPARRQHGQVRTRREEGRDVRRRPEDLLAVVEDEE